MAQKDSPSSRRRVEPTEPAATAARLRSADPRSERAKLNAYSTKILEELRALNAYLEARL